MASVFDYIFNIGGNYTATINGMTEATGQFNATVNQTESKANRLTGMLARFDYLNNVAQGIASGFEGLSAAGIRLDSQMHDLSAVAGVTGETLKQIEGFARDSAKAFGTDAAVAVEGYKLLLSQLSPELGKYPDVLREMGDCIQTTSKLMGGDGVAAAQVLTTAMNQYGVSLEDPMAASEEMTRMMNVMAAAGQAGSAELPAISAALQQCGMAAKAAGVSFEETNAAIQVLDKAGKKASEGGVALRNVLGQLSKGRFVEKQAREELEKAGIDVVALGDNSKSLKERLDMLKPMLNDSALLSKFFGVENANAARALIQGTDALQGNNNVTKNYESKTNYEINNLNQNLKTIIRNNYISYIKNFKVTYRSFSNFAKPTVKPVEQVSNFASYVTENLSYNTLNYNEELNSLAMPSYSTTLTLKQPNYFSENRIINISNTSENINKNEIGNLDVSFGTGLKSITDTTMDIKENRKKEIENDLFDAFRNVNIEERQTELTQEDIETIIFEMFRREADECLN